MPVLIPPMMITGSSMAQKLWRSALRRSLPVAFSATTRSSLRVMNSHISTRVTPMISPGTMPARNSLVIEMLPATPMMISGIDGGMIGAMMPPAAISPDERPSG